MAANLQHREAVGVHHTHTRLVCVCDEPLSHHFEMSDAKAEHGFHSLL